MTKRFNNNEIWNQLKLTFSSKKFYAEKKSKTVRSFFFSCSTSIIGIAIFSRLKPSDSALINLTFIRLLTFHSIFLRKKYTYELFVNNRVCKLFRASFSLQCIKVFGNCFSVEFHFLPLVRCNLLLCFVISINHSRFYCLRPITIKFWCVASFYHFFWFAFRANSRVLLYLSLIQYNTRLKDTCFADVDAIWI